MHAHEPIVPGLATAALRHTRGLIVATFHAETERALSYPIRSGRRKRYGSRIDALLAASARAAELAGTLYPGDYEVMPDPISGIFTPAGKTGTRVVAEWTGEGRGVARSLIRTVADMPGVELTLVWDRRGRRPMRPYVPPRARGRVRTEGLERDEQRARLLGAADVFVAAPDGNAAPGLGGSRQRRRRGLGRRRDGAALRGRPAAAGRRRRGPPAGAARAAPSGWPPRAHRPHPSAARRRWPSGWSRSTPACCGGAGHGPRRRRRGRR